MTGWAYDRVGLRPGGPMTGWTLKREGFSRDFTVS